MHHYSRLLIVLPCHSLEDFPTHHRGLLAADLLAHWTAIWHPALVASAAVKPDWQQADNPEFQPNEFPPNDLDPENTTAHDGQPTDEAGEWALESQANSDAGPVLAVIPRIAESTMAHELQLNLDQAHAVVITDCSDRGQIAASAIAANEPAAKLSSKLMASDCAALVDDFYAVGYAYLQIQLMTRQLRYSSNLDQTAFESALVSAATSACEGNQAAAAEHLTRCFDLLLTEKNCYYPVEPELFDVVLTAPKTLGNSFANQLETSHHLNVLLTGSLAQQLRDEQSANHARLQSLAAENKVSLIGGLGDELPDTLLSPESTINQLLVGQQIFKTAFAKAPDVFMRRSFGLTPATPGVLEQLNYIGAVHSVLDEGTFPASSNANIRWTGDDDRSVMAFAEVPLDANDAGSFLNLAVRLGEAIDSAHFAAAMLVHWPSRTCDAFGDLVKVASYGPLLGRFSSLNEYFDTVYDPGYGDSFTADDYRSPHLKQAVERRLRTPISSYNDYWRRLYALDAARSLITMAAAAGMPRQEAEPLQKRGQQLQTGIESAVIADDQQAGDSIDVEIGQLHDDLATAINRLRAGSVATSAAELQWLNPTPFKRRVFLESTLGQTAQSKFAKAIEPFLFSAPTTSVPARQQWVVELGPLSVTRAPFIELKASNPFHRDPTVAAENIQRDGYLLRNEFFELRIDETTGGIRSVELYAPRTNLAGQQLAIRIPASVSGADHQPTSTSGPMRTGARYTQMVADSVETIGDSPIKGVIISNGRLMDSETCVAKFRQQVSVVRGSQQAEIEVEIELLEPLSDSINHYVCSRLAWKDEASEVFANAQQTRQPILSQWFHATNYFEVIQGDQRLSMLTGGLPYHRRASRRMVDSLLMVGRETQTRFKFAIGVNVRYPLAAAVSRLTPVTTIAPPAVSPGSASPQTANEMGWLFHLNCKNILATYWEPIFDSSNQADPAWIGVRIRLRETSNRAGLLSIRTPQRIQAAERTDFRGEPIEQLPQHAEGSQTEPNRLDIPFIQNDYFQVAIYWKS